MRWQVLLGLVMMLIIYILLGGLCFHFLESTYEEDLREETHNFTDILLRNNPCLTDEELHSLIAIIVKAYHNGIMMTNGSSTQPNWDFASSLFFSVTVLTTVGYGNISPGTDGGRLFLVIYALIGIPLCLVTLAGMSSNIKEVRTLVKENILKCVKRPRLRKALAVTAIGVFGISLFILIPGIIFTHFEGWSYGISLYYGFVTLSTIGFGDYVAGFEYEQAGREIYRICVAVWIIIGLAWLAIMLSSIQDNIQTVVDRASKKMEEKYTRTDRDNNELSEGRENHAENSVPSGKIMDIPGSVNQNGYLVERL